MDDIRCEGIAQQVFVSLVHPIQVVINELITLVFAHTYQYSKADNRCGLVAGGRFQQGCITFLFVIAGHPCLYWTVAGHSHLEQYVDLSVDLLVGERRVGFLWISVLLASRSVAAGQNDELNDTVGRDDRSAWPERSRSRLVFRTADDDGTISAQDYFLGNASEEGLSGR